MDVPVSCNALFYFGKEEGNEDGKTCCWKIFGVPMNQIGESLRDLE